MADPQHDVVDLTFDSDSTVSATSEDDDLHHAIALSLQSVPTSPPVERHSSTENEPRSVEAEPAKMVGGILGMDRKKQEEERLARLKRKREHSMSPPLSESALKSGSTSSDSTSSGSISVTTTGLQATESQIKAAESATRREIDSSSPGPALTLQYPTGVVKKTWAFGFERVEDIKLEEVLQSSRLEAALMSSFQWDWDWLLPKLDTQRIKLLFVVEAKDEQTEEHHRRYFSKAPKIRLCFPPMEAQVNCMHSKLMLLFYATHLRVVVPTANLVPYDWGEPVGERKEGVMENTVFLVDLPKREAGIDGEQSAGIPFLRSMLYFLKAMGVQEDVMKKVQRFDFSKLAQIGFVHSIGGSHYGDAWRQTGACGLGQTLYQLGLRTSDPVDIHFVTSSVGSLNDEFLRSLYLVAQGDSGLSEYTLRSAKSVPPAILQGLEQRLGKDFSWEWKQHFRFYYPSLDTVNDSRGGPSGGGTICFQPSWWEGAKFPRNLMRDCKSQRRGLLMHNKVSRFLVSDSGSDVLSRCRSGSQNMASQSLWRVAIERWVGHMLGAQTCQKVLGKLRHPRLPSDSSRVNDSRRRRGKLVRDRTTKTPKLNCRNWECGVVLPIVEDQSDQAESSRNEEDSTCLDVFKKVVPVPMIVPGEAYQGNKRPWFKSEQE